MVSKEEYLKRKKAGTCRHCSELPARKFIAGVIRKLTYCKRCLGKHRIANRKYYAN